MERYSIKALKNALFIISLFFISGLFSGTEIFKTLFFWIITILSFIAVFLISLFISFIRKEKDRQTIPEGYLKGYRRICKTANEVTENKCWTCKNAIAFVTWHCEKEKCAYERCYAADEISKIDLYSGKLNGHWLEIPPPIQEEAPEIHEINEAFKKLKDTLEKWTPNDKELKI